MTKSKRATKSVRGRKVESTGIRRGTKQLASEQRCYSGRIEHWCKNEFIRENYIALTFNMTVWFRRWIPAQTWKTDRASLRVNFSRGMASRCKGKRINLLFPYGTTAWVQGLPFDQLPTFQVSKSEFSERWPVEGLPETLARGKFMKGYCLDRIPGAKARQWIVIRTSNWDDRRLRKYPINLAARIQLKPSTRAKKSKTDVEYAQSRRTGHLTSIAVCSVGNLLINWNPIRFFIAWAW
jgi:hypothetical protein